jgi:hypothetical protein
MARIPIKGRARCFGNSVHGFNQLIRRCGAAPAYSRTGIHLLRHIVASGVNGGTTS